MIGRKLAHYEIVAQLGEGGMGVVYKARDTQLDRFVAIKVLNAEATADLERRRRFVQEAKAASALNHPGIVTIYGISSDDGVDFIAMEYVAGQTLEQLIRGPGLAPATALKYALQAAQALSRAHAAGIVHRDIKPSNIMVTGDGLVKVLDFGVAKLLAADSEADQSSVTKTGLQASPRTEEGRIVGTAAYMSPEQAAGQPVDARSDIFSFGTVLYEMVTGVRAFGGKSSVSTLAAVLTAEPKPPSELSRHVPDDFERVILRCLRKDPAKRFQNVSDIVLELEDLTAETGTIAVRLRARRRPSRRVITMVAAGAVVLALAVGAALFLSAPGDSLPPPTVVNFTSYPGDERYPSLSPDGNQVAFSWTRANEDNYDIYIKAIGADTPLRLTTSSAEDGVPAWAPDGSRIAFVRREGGTNAVYLTPAVPNSERKLLEFRSSATHISRMSVSWTPDGQWLAIGTFESAGPTLSLLSVTGAPSRTLLSNAGGDGGYFSPTISRSGKRLAYAVCRDAITCDVWVVELDASFNPSGRPRRLTNNAATLQGLAWASDEKSIVYGAIFGGGSHLWRVNASGGTAERLELAGNAEFPAVSPIANRLVFSRSAGDIDVWKFDDGAPVSVLSSTATDLDPQLSPDATRAAFVTSRSGRGPEIWVATLDGTSAIPLTQPTGRSQGSPRWSPDGRWIAYDGQGEDGNWDIYVIEAAGGPSRRLTTHPSFEHFASFSRDGRSIYFRSGRTGRSEVWRVPAAGGAEVQVTTTGAAAVWESSDGASIYYSRHDGSGPEGPTSPVYIRALSGGPERKVLDAVFRWDFFPVTDGIYYVALIEARRFNLLELRFLSFATGKSTMLSRFQARTSQGLSVSADGKTILYSGRAPGAGTDLVMLQNFR